MGTWTHCCDIDLRAHQYFICPVGVHVKIAGFHNAVADHAYVVICGTWFIVLSKAAAHDGSCQKRRWTCGIEDSFQGCHPDAAGSRNSCGRSEIMGKTYSLQKGTGVLSAFFLPM